MVELLLKMIGRLREKGKMSDNWQMSPPYDVEGQEEIEGFIIFGYDPGTKVETWIHEGSINAFTLQPERYTVKSFDDGVRIIVSISKAKEEWFTKKMKEKFDKWKVSVIEMSKVEALMEKNRNLDEAILKGENLE